MHFNSRPPHGGRRTTLRGALSRITTSTHDLHTEVDKLWRLCTRRDTILQLTTSTRRSTSTVKKRHKDLVLQLTTSTRRSTGDVETYFRCVITSTHDLHTEVDPFSTIATFATELLQLTTSTRRSTASISNSAVYLLTSTHDLHTEVDQGCQDNPEMAETSTHDLHTEVDWR